MSNWRLPAVLVGVALASATTFAGADVGNLGWVGGTSAVSRDTVPPVPFPVTLEIGIGSHKVDREGFAKQRVLGIGAGIAIPVFHRVLSPQATLEISGAVRGFYTRRRPVGLDSRYGISTDMMAYEVGVGIGPEVAVPLKTSTGYELRPYLAWLPGAEYLGGEILAGSSVVYFPQLRLGLDVRVPRSPLWIALGLQRATDHLNVSAPFGYGYYKESTENATESLFTLGVRVSPNP